MIKRMVICCDGTWNEPETMEHGYTVPTNVLKIVRAIRPRDETNDRAQVIYYDRGVGSGTLGLIDRHVGGGTGAGISQNIQDCYRFICNNWQEGDELFLFGFSRGAYTVRSLSGLLATVGIMSKLELRHVPQAYAYYRTPPEERTRSEHHALVTRLQGPKPKIKLIGVWDTVGALGVPTPLLRKVQNWVGNRWKRFSVGFHNCDLVPLVENAFHALAIDERRGPFRPSIWTARHGQQWVQQVWFAGVHSNVGGGYPDSGLSDTAFTWLANRAMECGLRLDAAYMEGRVQADPLGKLEDSYSAGYRALEIVNVPPHVRTVGDCVDIGEMIHESVLQRLDAPLVTPYRPGNLVPEGGRLKKSQRERRDYVEVSGKLIPVFRERSAVRHAANDAPGTVIPAAGEPRPCQIVDLAAARGARLRLAEGLTEGTTIRLQSGLTGDQQGTVVWVRGSEAGIRFNA